MLGVNQLDFINYTTALKGNYRKGVHKLEAILANPTHAAEFAANLGGVSVVLGVPIGKEDKNSEALLSLLLASSVADDAVYTWLGQFYEFTSWDDLLGDAGRCQEMMADPFIWRAMASSGVAVGKSVATLAGLDCGAYADMAAVAASSTAMAAVIANSTALNAVVTSSTAMAAVIANGTALNAVVSSSAAMTAVAASQTAMTAVAASSTAMTAVTASPTAMAAIATSSMATAKYAASAAGLNPANYADMTELAASSTAMTAVAASSTARVAITSSATAKSALASSPLKQSVSTTAASGSYQQLVSGRACFIISATHNSSGWTFGLRYLYTSATGSEAKTYSSTTSAQSINLFTTNAGLAAFANSGSSTSGKLTLSYIPC